MSSIQSLSDEQLVALLAKSRKDAFEELFSRHWERLFAIGYQYVQSREVSEELIQDIFTSLWLNRTKLSIHTSIAAYLATAVKYSALRILQKELRKKEYRLETQARMPSQDYSTEHSIALNDLQESLDRELKSLPEKCRLVFEMSRYKNYSNREIADLLAISEKTVKNHITKALRILHRRLKDYIVTLLVLFFFSQR